MRLNVYQMYVRNDGEPGFWIQRDSWGNTCAQVIDIDAFCGFPPYYGNPRVIVNVHDLKTGELKSKGVSLSCPGNYTYKKIKTPEWAK